MTIIIIGNWRAPLNTSKYRLSVVSDRRSRYKTGKSNNRTKGREIKIFRTTKRKEEIVSTESRVTVVVTVDIKQKKNSPYAMRVYC